MCGRELEGFEAGEVEDGEERPEEDEVEEADEAEEEEHVEFEGVGGDGGAFERDGVEAVDDGGGEGENVAEGEFAAGFVGEWVERFGGGGGWRRGRGLAWGGEVRAGD